MAKEQPKKLRVRSRDLKMQKKDERRWWVQEVGDSKAGFELADEQTYLGGGHYARGRYNPDGDLFSSEGEESCTGDLLDEIIAAEEELRNEKILMLAECYRIIRSQGKKDLLTEYYPWGDGRKVAFVKRNNFKRAIVVTNRAGYPKTLGFMH